MSDEIITCRKGRRVRVCNTDAEGRMAMADVLCHLKEKVYYYFHLHLTLFKFGLEIFNEIYKRNLFRLTFNHYFNEKSKYYV